MKVDLEKITIDFMTDVDHVAVTFAIGPVSKRFEQPIGSMSFDLEGDLEDVYVQALVDELIKMVKEELSRPDEDGVIKVRP